MSAAIKNGNWHTIYFAAYEYMHWCMHLPKRRHVERSGIFFRLNGHQLLHHRYMHKNCNVVCELAEGSFDHSIFAKNYERVLSAEVARLFFIEVYELSRADGWTSNAHFSADGTLIESWASLKSFVRKDGGDQKKIDSAKDDDPGNPTVSFRGEKRKNDTHQSTTDPDSVLYCKAHGREARLCFGGHLLMENRHGLCADITLHNPIGEPEPRVALRQIDEHKQLHATTPRALAGDKNYHQKELVRGCRERGITPHVACKNLKIPGLDGRTTNRPAYQVSQRVRKRIEEIFGWMKTVGGLRRSRYLGWNARKPGATSWPAPTTSCV